MNSSSRTVLTLSLFTLLLNSAQAGWIPFIHESVDSGDRALVRQQEATARVATPVLSEVDFFFDPCGVDPQSGTPGSEPACVKDPAHAYRGGAQNSAAVSLANQQFQLTDPAPMKTYWWKMPVYAVAGLPRDVIDAGFGVVSNVPVLNALTGAYELSGAQFLMRHPQDVHVYGGGANANDHGFFNGGSWGWFSNLNQTVFREVDQARLEQMNLHNARLEAALRGKKEEADLDHLRSDLAAGEFLQQTLDGWARGDVSGAVGRLHSYCAARPQDFRARVYYLTAMLEAMDGGSPDEAWLDGEFRRVLAAYPAAHYLAMVETAREIIATKPDEPAGRLLLVWSLARARSTDEALEEAQKLDALRVAGLRESGMLFEVLMQRAQQLNPTRDQVEFKGLLGRAYGVVAKMKQQDAQALATRLAEARLAVLAGRYDAGIAALEALAEANPDSAACRYQLGVAHMLRGLRSTEYSERRAVGALKQARELSGDPVRAETAEEMIADARRIRPRQD